MKLSTSRATWRSSDGPHYGGLAAARVAASKDLLHRGLELAVLGLEVAARVAPGPASRSQGRRIPSPAAPGRPRRPARPGTRGTKAAAPRHVLPLNAHSLDALDVALAVVEELDSTEYSRGSCPNLTAASS